MLAIRENGPHAAAFLVLVFQRGGGSGIECHLRRELHRVKAHPGNCPGVHFRREFRAVDKRRADLFERLGGPAAHRNRSALEQAKSRVQGGRREAAHRGRRIRPRQPRVVEPAVARPILAAHHGEIGAEAALDVVELGEFAQRQSVPDRHGMKPDEARRAGLDRTFHMAARDRVYAIEDKEFFLRVRGRLERRAERGAVGIETRTHILDVEDQRIQLEQLLRLWRARANDGQIVVRRRLPGRPLRRLAVEAVDGKFGLLVDAVADFLIGVAADAMLGTEERDELHSRRRVQQINRRTTLPVDPALVRDQANLHAAQPGKIFAHEHIDAVQHGAGIAPGGFSGESAERGAQRHDVTLAIGVDAVAEENDERLRAGIDPHAAARPAGVAKTRAGGNPPSARAGKTRVDVPAEPASIGTVDLRPRHVRHG